MVSHYLADLLMNTMSCCPFFPFLLPEVAVNVLDSSACLIHTFVNIYLRYGLAYLGVYRVGIDVNC